MNEASVVNAEKWELGVWHRVNQIAHQMLALGPDPVVFPAKRHDADFPFLAREHAQSVAMQTRAVDHKIRHVFSCGAVDAPLAIPELERCDLCSQHDWSRVCARL